MASWIAKRSRVYHAQIKMLSLQDRTLRTRESPLIKSKARDSTRVFDEFSMRVSVWCRVGKAWKYNEIFPPTEPVLQRL